MIGKSRLVHLYKSFVETTYGVKSKENEIKFINSDVFLGDLRNIEFNGKTLLAPRSILTTKYGFYSPTNSEEIRIENDVWVGAGAIVLSGVTLGSGSIVGAGSVVKDDVPENTVVIGNPAKTFKTREIVEKNDLDYLFTRFKMHNTFLQRLMNSLKVGIIHYIFS